MADRIERAGGCLCGELRYALQGDPVMVAACHCQDCQRQSGSAFGMSLLIRREDFHWTSGAPKLWVGRADSGVQKDCAFCGTCGTRIYNALTSMPATFNVKPGTLDDTSWFEPKIQVWTDRKQPWVTLPDRVRAFERNPKR
jgi:hypothetical protein